MSVAAGIALAACSLQASSFSDVSDDAPYAPAVEDLKQSKVVEGYEDGTYRPDNTINRAEFVKIVAESKFDLTSEETDQCMIRNLRTDVILFPDVAADAWYARSVCMSTEYRLIEGYPDGTFGPEKEITFVEAAKIVVITYKPSVKPGTTVWYKPYVLKLQEWGAIPPSVRSLDSRITRGEMADMMYRSRMAQATAGSGSYAIDSSYQKIPPATVPPAAASSSAESSMESTEESSSSADTGTGEILPEAGSGTVTE